MGKLKHEREMREQWQVLTQRALDLQAAEYERRLGDLNHAHELEAQRNAASVSRADFDTYVETTRREQELAKAGRDAVHDRIESDVRGGARSIDRLVTQIGTVRGFLALAGTAGGVALIGVIYSLLSGKP